MASIASTSARVGSRLWQTHAWQGAIVPVALLIVWELCGQIGVLPRYLVAPSVIARELVSITMTGELPHHILSSLFRQSTGLIIGVATGTLIGLLSGLSKPVESFYEPLVSLLYPVPKIAILPLLFVLFGIGDASKIISITISIFFPTYIAAYYGVKSVNRLHVWTAMNCGASRWTVFFRVVLPSALPDIFNGLRISLALSFILMVTTELVVSNHGLGFMIAQAEQTMRFDRMYVAILVIGLLGFLADRALNIVRRRVLRWENTGKGRNND